MGSQIRRARDGEPFFVYLSEGSQPVEAPGCRQWEKYLHLWRQCKKWGFPFPGQWTDQPPWVIALMEEMDFAEIAAQKFKAG